MSQTLNKKGAGFGTAPVFFTAISTILGAILFLRFGFAVGNVGFLGTVAIVLIGHLVTIPTAMAIAEIATNQKVEGGGEYFIISRSFGFKIGATVGIALFMSQAISVAFYIIALGEAFDPVLSYYGMEHLDKRLISLPALVLLGLLILTKGADIGMKALYVVVAILAVSFVLFFLGTTEFAHSYTGDVFNNTISDPIKFFTVFAICFPAFTGMTAGVGLSGDLKDPSKSIPLGTLGATVFGMVIYVFIAYKLASSASAEDLAGDQFVMSKIALWGPIIPIGLACATISSALGSILVAPRTLQALAGDGVFPTVRANSILKKGKGLANEPFNASLVTLIIAFLVCLIGDVNFVAEIISMFFMVTYGSLCLIAFLHYFNSDTSYRPVFRTRWWISLIGAFMCIFLMFRMNSTYAFIALGIITLLYWWIATTHKSKKGFANLFAGAMFQMSRQMQIFIQKTEDEAESSWRPSVITVSDQSFNRFSAFDLLRWISYKYGFGTFIHQIQGYYSRDSVKEAEVALSRMKELAAESNVYLDTIISPSYTSAIAQMIQLPGISGKENNMILFEYSKLNDEQLDDILGNIQLVKAGDFDVCILGSSERNFGNRKRIHIWIRNQDYENANLMILLAYILQGHPDWKGGEISIFAVYPADIMIEESTKLNELIKKGRLPISAKNIELIEQKSEVSLKDMVNERSANSDLTIIGFLPEALKNQEKELFRGYDDLGNILFVNASKEVEIK